MGFANNRFRIARALFLVVVSAVSLGASSSEVQSYRDAAQELQAMLRSGEISSIRAYIVFYTTTIQVIVTPDDIRQRANVGCSTQLSDQQRNEIADLFDRVVLDDSDSRGGLIREVIIDGRSISKTLKMKRFLLFTWGDHGDFPISMRTGIRNGLP